MEDLIAFWRERLDEDEAAAKAAAEIDVPPWRADWAHDDGYADLRARDGEFIAYNEGTLTREAALHIARHDPARVLREVEADRALLAELERARTFSDHMFSSARPEGVAILDVPGQRVRAATKVLTLERVVKIRAARFSDHPGYRAEWKAQ